MDSGLLYLVGDVLKEAVPVSETLSRKTDPLTGGGAGETDHVFLQ